MDDERLGTERDVFKTKEEKKCNINFIRLGRGGTVVNARKSARTRA